MTFLVSVLYVGFLMDSLRTILQQVITGALVTVCLIKFFWNVQSSVQFNAESISEVFSVLTIVR